MRRALLQAARWSLRNAPAKVRRELVERWYRLGKSLVCSQQWIESMQHVNVNLFSQYKFYFLYCKLFFPKYFSIFLLWNILLSNFVYVTIFCVVPRITTLMSVSGGSDLYLFRRQMEKTRSVREELDGRVFVYRKRRHFSFINIMIKALFPICTFIWRVNIYVSRQGKV